MKTYKLHLIRHGLTKGNLDGSYVGGGIDMPLCDEGRKILEEMTEKYEYPGVGMLFTSPMLRARQTAEIIYPHMHEHNVLEELRECRFGEFEGKSAKELAGNENYTKWLDAKSNYVPKGGESGAEFAARCKAALIYIMNYLAQSGIHEAACVTHGGVIMSILSQLAVPRKPYIEWMSDNGCGFTVAASAAMIMRDEMVEAVGILPAGYLE